MTEPLILIAEDREDDVILIQSALAKTKNPYRAHVVRNGEDAISYLSGDGKYRNRGEYPFPDLVLLDLKMPRKDGFEVLQWLRQQPQSRRLHVIVLTSSEELSDRNAAYALGADSFLVKPVDFQDFMQLAHFITYYWLRLSKCPAAFLPLCGESGQPCRQAPKFADSRGGLLVVDGKVAG
jgi:CheY-like chemotaxis protein